jgi:ABC-type transport system involved in cytochrome c biogenesis permease component
VLSFEKTMALEREDSAIAGLLVAPIDRGVIYFSKLLSNLVLMLGLAAVITPVAILLFGFDLSAAPGGSALVMGIGIVGFAAVGTLFAAAVSSTRLQGGLLAMLVFPITLPLVIASTQMLIAMFRDGEPLGGVGLAVLVAFDAIFLVVSWLVFERVLEP